MSAPTRKRATPKKAAPATAEAPATVEEFDAELRGLAEEAGTEFPIAEDGSITPVKIGKRGRTPNPMLDLFEIDGVMYRVPAKPSPALMLTFFREARNKKVGKDAAVENLLLGMIGEDGMAALMASPEVTDEDMADILTIVSHIAFGTLSKLTGASGNS